MRLGDTEMNNEYSIFYPVAEIGVAGCSDVLLGEVGFFLADILQSGKWNHVFGEGNLLANALAGLGRLSLTNNSNVSFFILCTSCCKEFVEYDSLASSPTNESTSYSGYPSLSSYFLSVTVNQSLNFLSIYCLSDADGCLQFSGNPQTLCLRRRFRLLFRYDSFATPPLLI
ncbi:hypothetical protein VNO78_24865 [Psophocarpus tetragonolobus]|uniref:Uncharacterized protein n=1 Tax=Psophocarpus tetragonolobus TaxID=3891 RepID=A0AAN9S664_PSOTE